MTANDWRLEAACIDVEPELFYPDPRITTSRRQYLEPIKVCAACQVVAECLDWAYRVNDQWAVLGGMSPRQRAKTRAAYMRTIQEAS